MKKKVRWKLLELQDKKVQLKEGMESLKRN